MTDTPQPATAGETEVSNADAIEAAANAFRTFSYEAPETADRPRDEHGRFVAAQEIEAEGEAPAEPEAESQGEEETTEAAEEAQPEAVDLPPSWPAELAEEWASLPAPLQDTIVRREAERETAINAKFQEAANLRKAHEAEISEAQTNRQRYAEAVDAVLSVVTPHRPPISMLDPNSADYNPDGYHLAQARFQQTAEYLDSLKQQRQQIAAQQQQEELEQARSYMAEVEAKYRPVLLNDVPELSDPAKQGPVLNDIITYAISQGIGEHVFKDPEIAGRVTSPELHIAWKAMQYDKMMKAKGTVQPKAAKPAAPAVKPGVATSRSGVEAAQRKKAFERLDREQSVEAAADIFKMHSKGNYR
jgi:hypothetical protein